MITRRGLITIGTRVAIGGALITSLPIAVLALSPREEAWRLLDVARGHYFDDGNKAKTLEVVGRLFDHILKNIPPDISLIDQDALDEQLVAEIRSCIKGGKIINLNTCSNTAFGIYIIRAGLKNYMLPLVQAPNWKQYAGHFTGYVMAA